MRYIRDNNTFGFRYYAKTEYAHLSEPLRQSGINTDNQFMMLYDSIWQDCPDTGIITGAYILFYQGGPVDHCTHLPVPLLLQVELIPRGTKRKPVIHRLIQQRHHYLTW